MQKLNAFLLVLRVFINVLAKTVLLLGGPFSQCQMHSIFISSTADAPQEVPGVSKDQKFHAKSDFGSLKR